MMHLGDVTKLHGYEMEPVDCITGGSPCQDLSVAGQRAGLSGERSGLFFHMIRIVKEMRQHEQEQGKTWAEIRPRFLVVENVAGLFSSGKPKGADFCTVLTEIVHIVEPQAPAVPVPGGGWPKAGCLYDRMGRWSLAWRLHDAQFWGVPQRRSRVAVVADFAGLAAPEVLFERKGLSWNPEPGKTQGQEASAGAGAGADSAGSGNAVLAVNLTQDPLFLLNRTPCISSGSSDHGQAMCGVLRLNPVQSCECAGFKHKASSHSGSVGYQPERSPTLLSDQVSAVLDSRPIITAQNQRDEMRSLHDLSNAFAVKPGSDQRAYVFENHGKDARYTGPVPVSQTVSAYFGTGGDNTPIVLNEAVSVGNGQLEQITMKNICNTLDTMHDPQAIMVVHSLRAQGNDPCREDAATYPVSNGMVRRLTPLECERLQGFPDYWTQIGEVIGSKSWTDDAGQAHTELLYEYTDSTGKKRKTSDSARYKALGNAIALPFWFYLLRRISALYERPATLGSLFDGIGGFPLCWERCNGKGTAIWASEIEEFPMAVTRSHFGDDTNERRFK